MDVHHEIVTLLFSGDVTSANIWNGTKQSLSKILNGTIKNIEWKNHHYQYLEWNYQIHHGMGTIKNLEFITASKDKNVRRLHAETTHYIRVGFGPGKIPIPVTVGPLACRGVFCHPFKASVGAPSTVDDRW